MVDPIKDTSDQLVTHALAAREALESSDLEAARRSLANADAAIQWLLNALPSGS